MSRGANKGWDFIKVGGIYQYKESPFIGMVEILEDNSDEEYYNFRVQAIEGTVPLLEPFTVSLQKANTGVWNGMSQFYENPEYIPLPIGTPWEWKR